MLQDIRRTLTVHWRTEILVVVPRLAYQMLSEGVRFLGLVSLTCMLREICETALYVFANLRVYCKFQSEKLDGWYD